MRHNQFGEIINNPVSDIEYAWIKRLMILLGIVSTFVIQLSYFEIDKQNTFNIFVFSVIVLALIYVYIFKSVIQRNTGLLSVGISFIIINLFAYCMNPYLFKVIYYVLQYLYKATEMA